MVHIIDCTYLYQKDRNEEEKRAEMTLFIDICLNVLHTYVVKCLPLYIRNKYEGTEIGDNTMGNISL